MKELLNNLSDRVYMFYGQKFAFQVKALDCVKHVNKYGRFNLLVEKVERSNSRFIDVEYIVLKSSNPCYKPLDKIKVKHKTKTILNLLKPI